MKTPDEIINEMLFGGSAPALAQAEPVVGNRQTYSSAPLSPDEIINRMLTGANFQNSAPTPDIPIVEAGAPINSNLWPSSVSTPEHPALPLSESEPAPEKKGLGLADIPRAFRAGVEGMTSSLVQAGTLGRIQGAENLEDMPEDRRLFIDWGRQISESGERPKSRGDQMAVDAYKKWRNAREVEEVRQLGSDAARIMRDDTDSRYGDMTARAREAVSLQNIGRTITTRPYQAALGAIITAAESAPQTALAMIPGGGTAAMIGAEAARFVDAAEGAGLDDPEIINSFAAAYGTVSGAIEKIGSEILVGPAKLAMKGIGKNAVGKPVSNAVAKSFWESGAGRSILKSIGVGAVTEGLEEAMQGQAQETMLWLALEGAKRKHPDREAQYTESQKNINLSPLNRERLEEAWYGALSGGVMRGVSTATGKTISGEWGNNKGAEGVRQEASETVSSGGSVRDIASGRLIPAGEHKVFSRSGRRAHLHEYGTELGVEGFETIAPETQPATVTPPKPAGDAQGRAQEPVIEPGNTVSRADEEMGAMGRNTTQTEIPAQETAPMPRIADSREDYSKEAGTGRDEWRPETANETRAKFDAIPSPEVSTAEVKSIERGQGFVKRVVDWLTQKDVLGDYRNADTGMDITINHGSVRNVISHGAADGKVALLERAPELVENGILLETTIKGSDGAYRKATDEEINDPKILKNHILAARAVVDGEASVVGIVVREDYNGKRYYDHALKVEGQRSIEDPSTNRASHDTSKPSRSVSDIVQEHLNNKIQQSPQKVNTQSKKSSAPPKSGGNAWSEASRGDYDKGVRSGADYNASASDGLRPVGRPEMVTISQAVIDGATPAVRQKMEEGVMGLYTSKKDPKTGEVSNRKIDLQKDIFKDPDLAARVFAHEVGHAGDFDYGKNPAIDRELWELSRKWRPVGEGTDMEYRQSRSETLADAMSVLMNDPAYLKQEAPAFWKEFTGWLRESDTPFAKAYKDAQELYSRGEGAVYQSRKSDIMRGSETDKAQRAAQSKTMEIIQKKRNSFSQFMHDTKKVLFDRQAGFIRLTRRLKKAGVIVSNEDNPVRSASNIDYVKSQAMAYTNDIVENVGKILGGWNSGGWGMLNTDNGVRPMNANEALGTYMAVNRMAHDERRSKVANKLSPEEAKDFLRGMEAEIGRENFKRLKDAAAEYVRIRKEHIFPKLKACGAFSEELLEILTNNDHYAKFKVVFEGEEANGKTVGPGAVGIHAQHGTLRDIANTFISMAEGDVRLLEYAARNRHKLNAINILKLDSVKEAGYYLEPTKRAITQKMVKTVKDGKEVEELITVKGDYIPLTARAKTEDGRPIESVPVSDGGVVKMYDVDKEVADMMNKPSTFSNWALNALRFTADIQRDVFVNKMPTFHIKNIFRDVFATLALNKGFLRHGFVFRLPRALVSAWRLNQRGHMDPVVKEMLMEGALNVGLSTGKEAHKGEFEIEKKLRALEPQAQKRYVRNTLKKIGSFLEGIAASIEMGTKIAGYRTLKKSNPEMTASDRAFRTRKRIGTPDALAGGTLKAYTNSTFLFSNITVQGWRAGLEALKESPLNFIAFQAMSYLVSAPGILAQAGLLTAIFGRDAEEVEEQYNDTISHWKRNNYVFPSGLTDTDGTPLVWTIPKGHVEQFGGAIAYNILDMMIAEDYDVAKLADLIGDELIFTPSGMQPILQVAKAYIEWFTGQNPEDMFRNREIFPRNIYGAGLEHELPVMLGWTGEKLLGSTIAGTAIDIKDLIEGEKDFEGAGDGSLMEILARTTLNLPGIGRVPGQLLRRAEGGYEEMERREQRMWEKENKRMKLD